MCVRGCALTCSQSENALLKEMCVVFFNVFLLKMGPNLCLLCEKEHGKSEGVCGFVDDPSSCCCQEGSFEEKRKTLEAK